MSVVSILSNHYKYKLMAADIDFDSHTFKIILMNPAFAFDEDTHAKYSDVSASELGGGNGYTVGGETLAGGVLVEDDVNDRAQMTWDDMVWNAGPGNIGPFGSQIIYDDTDADKTVVGCTDYGVNFTIPAAGSYTAKDITVRTLTYISSSSSSQSSSSSSSESSSSSSSSSESSSSSSSESSSSSSSESSSSSSSESSSSSSSESSSSSSSSSESSSSSSSSSESSSSSSSSSESSSSSSSESSSSSSSKSSSSSSSESSSSSSSGAP